MSPKPPEKPANERTTFCRPLIALSLSDADEGFLHYSALLARSFGWSDIHFAHVIPNNGAGETAGPGAVEDKLREEVRRVFEQPLPPGQPTFHVVRGVRLDQLLGLAAKHDRDLIVLGHRKERSGRRSLARRLAMLAPSSVWLVPQDSLPQIRSILVPTDFSSHSADALSVAAAIARAVGLSECRAVHVFFDPSTVRYDEHVEEVLGQEEAAFERFLAGADTQGVQVHPVFEESTHPPQAILRLAQRCGTDLIVMNTRGRSQAASVLLGSITSETMAATSVPLLAVKHHGNKMSLLEALLNHRLWETASPKSN